MGHRGEEAVTRCVGTSEPGTSHGAFDSLWPAPILPLTRTRTGCQCLQGLTGAHLSDLVCHLGAAGYPGSAAAKKRGIAFRAAFAGPGSFPGLDRWLKGVCGICCSLAEPLPLFFAVDIAEGGKGFLLLIPGCRD